MTVICPQCGDQQQEETLSCTSCGGSLAQAGPVNQTLLMPPPPAAMPPPPELQQHLVGPQEYVGLWIRFAAMLVDVIILVAAVVVLMIPLYSAMSSNNTIAQTLSVALFLVLRITVPWLYFALMESSANQGTLGKMALGVKVVDQFNQRVTFGRATGRFFGKILSGAVCYIGFIMAAFTQNHQALHDIIAGTYVVKK